MSCMNSCMTSRDARLSLNIFSSQFKTSFFIQESNTVQGRMLVSNFKITIGFKHVLKLTRFSSYGVNNK